MNDELNSGHGGLQRYNSRNERIMLVLFMDAKLYAIIRQTPATRTKFTIV